MKDKSINYYRIEKAIKYMEANFKSHPDLDKIAENVNLSPFHFQRMFLDWVGITPKKFLQYLTVSHLKNCIYESKNVIEAADMAGLSSQSRVYDLFVKIEGVSPQQYKSAGQGLKIYYGYHASPFGMCFIAVAEKGVCELTFIHEDIDRQEFTHFEHKWHFAERIHKPDFTQDYINRIFKPTPNREDLQLLVQGTDFQIKVWEALVNIPFGQVCSYEQMAKQLGIDSSPRAVATAAGKSPVTYLIPCHRIITKSGGAGEFHLGRVRKKLMLAWEMASISA